MRGSASKLDTAESEDRFLHAPAENIPAPDNSYDVVFSRQLILVAPDTSSNFSLKE